MKRRYNKYDYSEFEDALYAASNWQKYILSEDEKELPNDKLIELCLDRCLDEHVNVIDDLKDEIEDLEDQVIHFENDIRYIKNDNDELIESILPNKTLDDVEKIEFIQANWDKITYENLKKIV